MLLHGVILLVVMLLAALSPDRKGVRFLLPLAFPPLIRLLSLSLPLTNFNFIYWYAVIGVPLFIANFLTIRATGLKAEEIGLRVSWRELPLQILIGLSGLMLGLVEYLILRPESLVSEPSWEQILITVLILMVFTGFLEELIFRGLMQTSAIQALGQIGLMFVALVFSVLHIGYRSILDVIFVFTVAIAFGVLVQRYKSLLGVSIAHGLINVSLYLIFPFLFK
jgi:membrane protease YdiL (CAAX protease family)